MKFTFILVACVALALAIFMWWVQHGAGKSSPRIGLSVSDAWYDDLGFHRVAYDVALARAGSRVVSLRPSDHSDMLSDIVPTLDGIMLAGGGDVDPSIYGGTGEKAKLVDPVRDEFEREILKLAEKHGVPVVGICRGIQLMAAHYDGDIRDLRLEGELAKTHGIGPKSMNAHQVEIMPNTRLAGILGASKYKVNSFHAQAVKDPGRMIVAAMGDGDVIEAVELPGDRMVIGIQWHPEIMGVLDKTQRAIIEAFVEEARMRHDARH